MSCHVMHVISRILAFVAARRLATQHEWVSDDQCRLSVSYSIISGWPLTDQFTPWCTVRAEPANFRSSTPSDSSAWVTQHHIAFDVVVWESYYMSEESNVTSNYKFTAFFSCLAICFLHQPCCIGVCEYTRTREYGSGRINASRVRVYPLLPVKKVPKSHNY